MHHEVHTRSYIVEGDDIPRVCHGDDESVALDRDRENLVTAQKRGGDHLHGGAIDRVVTELHEWNSQLRGPRRGNLSLGYLALARELADEKFVARRGCSHGVKALDGHEAAQHEDLGK